MSAKNGLGGVGRCPATIDAVGIVSPNPRLPTDIDRFRSDPCAARLRRDGDFMSTIAARR